MVTVTEMEALSLPDEGETVHQEEAEIDQLVLLVIVKVWVPPLFSNVSDDVLADKVIGAGLSEDFCWVMVTFFAGSVPPLMVNTATLSTPVVFLPAVTNTLCELLPAMGLTVNQSLFLMMVQLQLAVMVSSFVSPPPSNSIFGATFK